MTIVLNGATAAHQIIPRPASNQSDVTFNNIPVGAATATATAFPNADGTGTAQATASVPLQIQDGIATPINISMDSTISRIETNPPQFSSGPGQTTQITCTPKDSAGNVVLIMPTTLLWSSDNKLVATVDSTGLVTAVALGKANITVTETESGKSLVVPVTVGTAVPILIADHGNFRLVKTDNLNSAAGWSTIGTQGTGPLQFQWICGMNVDSTGRIYLTDADVYSLTPPGFTPKSLSRIARMDNMSGAGWVTFGSYGSGVGQFNQPADIYPAPDGYIYIADMGNNRIVRINDMSGAGWKEFGKFGQGVNQLHWPNAITMDSKRRLYIADNYNSRIVRINDMSGAGWAEVGKYGSVTYPGPNPAVLGWDGPCGIALDSKDRIYVTDLLNDRITRFDDMDPVIAKSTWVSYGGYGRANQNPGPGFFWWPQAIKIDHNDRLYVADELNSRVVIIDDMTGAGWTTVGTKGSGVNQLNDVSGVALP